MIKDARKLVAAPDWSRKEVSHKTFIDFHAGFPVSGAGRGLCPLHPCQGT